MNAQQNHNQPRAKEASTNLGFRSSPFKTCKRSSKVFYLWSAFTISMSLITGAGCGQKIRSISAADSRLPSEAKERIADAEDAVLIARSRLQDAKKVHRDAELSSDKFSRKPPNFGQATSIAKQLNAARLNLASLEQSYAEVNYKLSRSRLKLVYAQTAMRYDLAVYDLQPLNLSVDQNRASLLLLRKERKQARAKMKGLVDKWWGAYKQLAGSGGTQAFWIYEFTR